jgi:hypothetical protein
VYSPRQKNHMESRYLKISPIQDCLNGDGKIPGSSNHHNLPQAVLQGIIIFLSAGPQINHSNELSLALRFLRFLLAGCFLCCFFVGLAEHSFPDPSILNGLDTIALVIWVISRKVAVAHKFVRIVPTEFILEFFEIAHFGS